VRAHGGRWIGEPPHGGGEDGGAALFLVGTVLAKTKNTPKKIPKKEK